MNRTVSSWLALAAGTIVAIAASVGAYQLADYSWAQVVDYRSPYAVADVPETSAAPPADVPIAARTRVVFVIIDGLREDVSRKMPTLNSLRDRGYDAVVRNDQPSLSFPTWTTLLSGAPPRISGVTTNWFEGRVPVETLFDVALGSGEVVAVSAPTDFEQLYAVRRSPNVLLRDWEKGAYMTGGMVDNAISLANEASATLVVLHSPDIDEAGHASGGASREYLDTALKVDRDLGRLVTALQDDRTVFVIASDHGHIDTGGHGGWETVVTDVPAIFAGSTIKLGKGEGTQDQVAPTIALLMGLPAPRHALGLPLPVVDLSKPDTDRFAQQQISAYDAYTAVVTGRSVPAPSASAAEARAVFATQTDARLARERSARFPASVALGLLAVALLAVIGVLSWRALAASVAGAVFYYLVYSGLFFLVHGYAWSLSAFNSEGQLKAFFNGRMVEAVIAGVVAAFVAADIYLGLRADPKRPRGEYLPGWLALGTAVVLTVQSSLLAQVAWFLWRWGATVTWVLPDLRAGFKYDLDLIQATAIGALAILGPATTWLVGRYHPIRPRTVPAPEEEGAA